MLGLHVTLPAFDLNTYKFSSELCVEFVLVYLHMKCT